MKESNHKIIITNNLYTALFYKINIQKSKRFGVTKQLETDCFLAAVGIILFLSIC